MFTWTGGDEHNPNLIRGILWALVMVAVGVTLTWALWKVGTFTLSAMQGWRP